jgi:hypothetical protein
MPRQVFTAGEILTAANMNDLSDATVMVFDDSAARGSAIPTPSEGMVTYLKDTNQVQAFNGSAFASLGTILQVVSTTKTDTFTTTSTSFVDVTGLSVSITPSSATSKVFVLVSVPYGNSTIASEISVLTLSDGSDNNLIVPTSPGSRSAGFVGDFPATTAAMVSANFSLLHSPATTSAFTYKVRALSGGGATVTINRGGADQDQATRARGVSTITVMEVAG